MVRKLLDTIRRIGGVSEFETYLVSLQRHSPSGAPTVAEASKDYQATHRTIMRYGM